MLEPILGSSSSEKVLIFLAAREQGYAREIARFFATDLTPIQRQLEKLEDGGVLWEGRVCSRSTPATPCSKNSEPSSRKPFNSTPTVCAKDSP